ncbi:MAG: hypothetical protein O7B99_03420 [Planctomycetota bacterium]|nr:hypothetical protein [Planctomycetota bacterium]
MNAALFQGGYRDVTVAIDTRHQRIIGTPTELGTFAVMERRTSFSTGR